jgi:recombination protein RecT
MTDVQQQAAKPPLVVIRDQFQARIGELRTALPAHISAERFVRVIMTAIQIHPDLAACERMSLWNSAMRCANDGLMPDGREAALVPFKGKVQYMPMYQGLLKKFRNSGQFKWVTAGIVYQGEEYVHFIDETGEHFRHVPSDNPNPQIRRVYALATTLDGGSFIADLPLKDVDKRRAMSRATREDAPWKQWPDEMMKKTAIRVLSKLLPMSSDLDALIRRDEEALLGVEAVAETRVELAERPSTQAALDHFGGDSTKEVLQTEPQSSDANDVTDSGVRTKEETVPEPGAGQGTAGAADGPAETPAPLSAVSDPQRLRVAFLAGQHARDIGVPRKNPPLDYRDPKRTDECKAWWDGWDSVEE